MNDGNRNGNGQANEQQTELELLGAADYPSERDRALYEAVCQRGQSFADAGRAFELDERTTRDIVRRTERALARKQSEFDRLTSTEARQLHQMRLEIMLGEAMFAWHVSKHDQVTHRTKEKDLPPGEMGEREVQHEKTVTLKSQTGNPRYLDLARRISADIAVVETKIEALRTEEEKKHVQPLTMEQRKRKLMAFFADIQERAELYVLRRDDEGLRPAADDALPPRAEPGADGLSPPEVP